MDFFFARECDEDMIALMLLESLKEWAAIHEAAQQPLTYFLPLQLQGSI